MRIRAHIDYGPHITKRDGFSPEAFGVRVQDFGIDPSIELPRSVLYGGNIAPALAKVTHHYSIHDEFYGGNNGTHREVGAYAHEDAQAIVEHGLNHKHKICVNGETLANVAELWKRIRAGSIAPIVSHENGQIKGTVLSVKKAFQHLIDSLFLSFGEWRSRRH